MASYERIALEANDVAGVHANSYSDPQSAPHPRAAFRRQSSFALTPADKSVEFRVPSPGASGEHGATSKEGGLGISYVPASPERIKRVPVGSKETMNSTYSTPELQSGRTSQATTYQNTPNDGSYVYVESPDTQMLRVNPGGAGSIDCPTHRDVLDPKMSWLSISILILAIYSTVFSALYLILAMWKPRWGQNIGTHGHISISTASLLSALFAKTIELSFVTVFVTFLGQALSRRAFRKSTSKGGITIAEMTMRTWVMQPGTLITHWEAVRYSAITILGGITLIAAFVAVFYTTAAEALVAPKLKDGILRGTTLQGMVAMSFANAPYLENTCQTPVKRVAYDPDQEGTTCLQIEHAGQSWHNFKSYIDTWVNSNNVGNMSNTTSYDTRPPPIAMLFDNTTVQGQWIQSENPTIVSGIEKRMVQDLTMAMPHANVFNAARDPVNHILQPEDLEGGAGEYTITASVPVPISKVLCVGMTESELAPIVYTEWPNPSEPGSNYTLNVTTWPTTLDSILAPWTIRQNKTVVDELFGFGKNTSSEATIQLPPVFPKYPIDYNTIVSFWSNSYGQLSVYLLAKPPTVSYPVYDEYVMCSVKAQLYSNCTTQYHAEQSGGHLSVFCDEDPRNIMRYMQSQELAPLSIDQPDWKDVATEWINSISLSQGITNGNASGSRMLTQMIPPDSEGEMNLLDNMPSIGEALNVLAGCTLLLASSMSPFIHYWSYSENTLAEPQAQTFNATVTSRDYASGGTQQWQGIFYVVLLALFFLNVFCLIYLFLVYCRDGQVTDFTEPQNLFSLAINSPASQTMSGACGGGPEGDTFAKRWHVGMQRDEAASTGSHPHFYVRFPHDETLYASPVVSRQKKTRVRRMEGFEVEQSPAEEQYMRLSVKWGSIL